MSDQFPGSTDFQQSGATSRGASLLLSSLGQVTSLGASDLHIHEGRSSVLRIDGNLTETDNTTVWTDEALNEAIRFVCTPQKWQQFEDELELDISYTTPENIRFRVNVYRQQGRLGAAFRIIPTRIKSLSELDMPEVISSFASLPRGLVLVTGPTGSGKSTTLAAIINEINLTRPDHIMTVEDPIEFVHQGKRSLINQREVGTDTVSFSAALKHVLRQDPDVILIGEMRDLETVGAALTAAETGHLVFGTLHTQDAPQTIDRVIDVFPPHQQSQVRTQLSSTLKGIVCQNLVPLAQGRGRTVATEVMIATPAISNLVREGKTFQIPSAMQAGKVFGMHTMDQSLAQLVTAGKVRRDDASERAHDLEAFEQLVQAGASGMVQHAVAPDAQQPLITGIPQTGFGFGGTL